MSKRASPTLIGIFVVGAVVLTVVAVVVLGSGRFFREKHSFVVYFTGSVNGLSVGAPVKVKGVPIGSVSDISLNIGDVPPLERTEEQRRVLRIPVIIDIDAEHMRAAGARVPDRERLRLAIDRGLRARLATESFVTGVLYVALDFYPGSPVELVADPSVPYPEIPALPTTLEQAESAASKLIQDLQKADINALVASIQGAIDGIKDIVHSPGLRTTLGSLDVTQKSLDETLASFRDLARRLDGKVDALGTRLDGTASEAAAAMGQARAAMEAAREVLDPRSPLVDQLGRTLADLSAAARALQRLADDLARDPSALVRGKAAPQEAP